MDSSSWWMWVHQIATIMSLTSVHDRDFIIMVWEDKHPSCIKACSHPASRLVWMTEEPGEVAGERFLCWGPVGQLGNILSEKLQNSLINLFVFSWAVFRSLPKTGRTQAERPASEGWFSKIQLCCDGPTCFYCGVEQVHKLWAGICPGTQGGKPQCF